MKIYINRKPINGPWGGGNLFVSALYDALPNLGYNILDDISRDTPDIIFLQSPKPDEVSRFSINEAISLKQKHNTKIVMRVNDCDARKGTTGVDEMWQECSKYIDKTIFVSNWMMNYFLEKGWYCKNNYVVYNGVNTTHFNPQEKIKNGKVNIVTHHWSNNRMKGFDIYESIDRMVGLDNNYTFTYIGRELGTFKNTKVVKPLFGKSLGEELGKYDVYVSASRFDPGPNHILESLACNIPTYVHSDGGGCIEFAGETHKYSGIDELITKIKNPVSNDRNNLIRSWKDCIVNLEKVL
jgi:glycosyltransferase involved in cell wall biosynthesis